MNCDDYNPCTDDTCDPGAGCKHSNNTVSCDDGDACTENDACTNGACKGARLDCDDHDACTTDSCNSTTGCEHQAASCDDGNVCTDDSCDPAIGCVHDGSSNTAPCASDGDLCTNDLCSNGSCTHPVDLDCDDGNVCTDDSCQPTTGACEHIPNTMSCDDNDACTTGDSCVEGSCQGGEALNCDDHNPCTDDSCAPTLGCEHLNGTGSCDTDGSVCTPEVCAEGACTPLAPLDCDDGNQCTNDTCSAVTGCSHLNKTNGSSCNDGSACTSNDVCTAGVCSGTLISCDDGNICTDDSCDPTNGCVHTNNTVACSDGESCSVGDVCSGGQCITDASACGCDTTRLGVLSATAYTVNPANGIAANAIDDDPNTAWSFNSVSDSIYLDLGADKLVNRVTFDWTATSGRAWSIQYAAEGADLSAQSTAWTTVYTESAGTHISGGATAGLADITGLDFVGRYVRMLAWTPNESSAATVGLKQMTVYGKVDTSCPTADITGCGTTSTAVPATYQVEAETVTCDTRAGTTTGSGYTACVAPLRAAAGNSSGMWRALANGESLGFGSVDGGASGGAAILRVRQSPGINVSTLIAVYVKYSDTQTEQLYGVVSAAPNGASSTTFADSQAIQIYLHAGTVNTIELRDFAGGAEPYIDYISVSPQNGVNRACQGSPFTVSTFNQVSLIRPGAFDAGTGFTCPDRREIKSTGVSPLSGNSGSAYNLDPTTTLSFEMDVANMTTLTSVKIRLAAISTNSNLLFLGVWDGSSWTDKRVSDYGGLITPTLADRVVPLSEYGAALNSISKIRLSTVSATAGFYFSIDEITVQ